MRILLAEDNELLGLGIEINLREAAYTVDWVRNGRDAKLALATTQYALAILDLGLPKISGHDLLRAVRDAGNNVPVLLLSARATVEDRVSGLDAGADDYLTKPFDLMELLARCRALVRRSQQRASEKITWREVTIDTMAKTVFRNGALIVLTAKEWAILLQLITHQDVPQSRAQLEECLYGWQEEIESNVIQVHVSNLRKKLGTEVISTVRGVGYIVYKT
ncbi:response regulator [Paraburkholderia humisilvae]|uniref:Transcriptional regulatory protein QseB n=1 Tax=Paraburkholderia humisilvae TaxID=627669 RepID=A0A6J5F6K2_9BURK|nr:response regulator transcription factor [Paraburkholderia humisilvae]CAB3774429.1 Transcriptional regulatory protein QseB [Paraburkholderia humisilvae]